MLPALFNKRLSRLFPVTTISSIICEKTGVVEKHKNMQKMLK